ncbi:MAG: hypothetical protein IKG40_01735 [Bacilli bacterium]|nr:hypothetical protein [Bacilli bacterium]
MDIMQKINKLDFSNKEVVKVLLNIIKDSEKDYNMCSYLKYGFFDNETDLNNFKDNLDLYNLGMLLQVKHDLKGNGVSDLHNNCLWICYDEMEVFKLGNEIKNVIMEMLNSSDVYNINENIINNLLKLSLSY